MSTLLLIITYVITSLLSIITKSLLSIITVIMDLLLPIITRSIIGNKGSLLPIIDLGNLQMLARCFHIRTDCKDLIGKQESY